jgi:hypothetical protein
VGVRLVEWTFLSKGFREAMLATTSRQRRCIKPTKTASFVNIGEPDVKLHPKTTK